MSEGVLAGGGIRPNSRLGTGFGWGHSLTFPILTVQSVLDIAVLIARDCVRPVRPKYPQLPQSGLLHHPRGGVHDHGLGQHPPNVGFGEGLVNQSSRTLGGLSVVPGGPPEPIPQLRFVGRVPIP